MATFIKIRVIRVKLVRRRGRSCEGGRGQSKRATCGTFIKNAIRSMCYMKHKVRGSRRGKGEHIGTMWEEGRGGASCGEGSAVVQRDAREILRQILWHDKRVAYEMT